MTDVNKDQLQNFLRAVQQYIGRDLSAPEALVLATVFPSLQGRPANAGGGAGDFVSQARQRAGQALDLERQRVNDTMNSTLRALGAVPAPSAAAQEGSALELLNKTTSLQQLQQAGQLVAATDKSGAEAPAIVQIVERLMVLVKDEVERCFQEQFGQLNQQMAKALQQLNDWVSHQQSKEGATPAAATAADTPASESGSAAATSPEAAATAAASGPPVAETDGAARAAEESGSTAAVPAIPVPETAGPESSVPESAIPEPAVPEPAEPEPAVPETAVPDPVVPEPAVPESSVPEPAVPEPAAAGSGTDAIPAGN